MAAGWVYLTHLDFCMELLGKACTNQRYPMKSFGVKFRISCSFVNKLKATIFSIFWIHLISIND